MKRKDGRFSVHPCAEMLRMRSHFYQPHKQKTLAMNSRFRFIRRMMIRLKLQTASCAWSDHATRREAGFAVLVRYNLRGGVPPFDPPWLPPMAANGNPFGFRTFRSALGRVLHSRAMRP